MLNREHKPQEPLNDRWAIAEIVSLHGHIFDAGQLDRLEEIFTPEIVYDMSAVGIGVFEGIEVVRNAAASHHGDWRISRRIISPVRTARVS
jgi:hypothetical protein